MKAAHFRKISIIFILVFAFTYVNAQVTRLYFDSNWKQCDKSNASFYRDYKKVNGNDSLYEIKDYYISGSLQMITASKDYINLVKYGMTTFYYENGNKSSEGNCLKNIRIGEWNSWYEDGAGKFKANYSDNGKPNGESTFWHKNGQVESAILYKDGKIVSGGKKYYDSGSLKMEYDYTPSGDKSGEWKWYFKNNRLNVSGSYKDDHKNAAWKEFYSSGPVKKVGEFSADKKVGEWSCFDENGKLKARKIYKDDELKKLEFFDETGAKLKRKETVTIPEFTDNDHKNIQDYLSGNVNLPETGITAGTLLISLVIDEDGNLIHSQVNQSVSPDIDSAFIKVVRTMKKWKAGMYNNVKSAFFIDVPIEIETGRKFMIRGICYLSADRDNFDAQTYMDNTLIFNSVEEQPEFPGGEQNRTTFLINSIYYPKEARRLGIQGRVFITFVVESTGYISNIRILRGLHPLLDNEAIRVVRSMPRWKPGYQSGVPVRVQFNLPLKFTIH